MLRDGTLHMIRDRGYKCSDPRDFRLLPGWLELMIIFTKLIGNVSVRRQRLESVEIPSVTTWADYGTGIQVDKRSWMVWCNKSVYRSAPTHPTEGDTGIPPVLPDPGYCELPPCFGDIERIMQHPELTETKNQLVEQMQRLGMNHADVMATAWKLARILVGLKQYVEAEAVYRDTVLPNLERLVGPSGRLTMEAVREVIPPPALKPENMQR